MSAQLSHQASFEINLDEALLSKAQHLGIDVKALFEDVLKQKICVHEEYVRCLARF